MNPDEVYRLAFELYGDPVEAKIAAAQMQLETGGGSAMPGHNLFGIKGPGQSLRTMESVDGAMTPTTASFRTYPNPRASIIDRLRFLQTNPRYAEAGYFEATTPEQKADALQRAGYATDPNYAAKLKSILSGGSMIYDASDFPQFAPSGMGLVPVSAQPPGPAGVLGVMPAQPLLGPTQPQSLLDRFAPGSGYGYDVALGIAQTQGGPMTALAGGFAHAKDKAFERQMTEANLQLAQARGFAGLGPTSKEREALMLRRMGKTDEEIVRALYPGGTGAGFEYKDVNGVTYRRITLPDGTFQDIRISGPEQTYREQTIEAERTAETRGEILPKVRQERLESASDQFAQASSQLGSINRLISDFESGKLDNMTGPLRGYVTRYFDPEVALLEMRNTTQALEALSGVNLAPISNYEVQLVQQLYASPLRNKDQNLAILRELRRINEKKRKMSRKLLSRFANETIEQILSEPTTLDYEPNRELLRQSPQTSVPAAPGGASYIPQSAQEALDFLDRSQ